MQAAAPRAREPRPGALPTLGALAVVVLGTLLVLVGLGTWRGALHPVAWLQVRPATLGDLLPATELARADLPGGTVQLRDGRVELVVAWATWCRPCHVELRDLTAAHVELQGRGVRILALATDDDLAAVRQFLEAHPLPFEVALADPRTARLLGADANVPVTWLVDAEGRAAWRAVGWDTGGIRAVVAAVDALARRGAGS